jgi:hypothetical protein
MNLIGFGWPYSEFVRVRKKNVCASQKMMEIARLPSIRDQTFTTATAAPAHDTAPQQ